HAHDHLGEQRLAETVRGIVLAHALRCAIDGIEVHGREHARQLRPMFDVPGNGFIAQLGEVVGPPVPLQAGNKEAVEEALYDWKRRRTDVIEERLAQGSHGLERRLSLFEGPGTTPNDSANVLKMKGLGEYGSRGNHEKSKEAVHVRGRVYDKSAIGAEDVRSLFHRPKCGPEVNHIDRM